MPYQRPGICANLYNCYQYLHDKVQSTMVTFYSICWRPHPKYPHTCTCNTPDLQ